MIEDYQLVEPSWEMAIEQLQEFMDRDSVDDLLTKIRRELSITEKPKYDLDTLSLIFKRISREPGLASVVGRSLMIRVATYQNLKKSLNK